MLLLFYCCFTLHIAHTLGNLPFAVCTLHVTYTLQYSASAVFTLPMTYTLQKIHAVAFKLHKANTLFIADPLINYATTLFAINNAQVSEPLCLLFMIVALTPRILAFCRVLHLLILYLFAVLILGDGQILDPFSAAFTLLVTCA